MEQYLFNTAIILLGSHSGLRIVDGPGGVGGAGDPNVQNQSDTTLQNQTVNETAAEELTLTEAEQQALEANKSKPQSPDKVDPRLGDSLKSAEQNRTQVSWLYEVIGKNISKSNLQNAKDAAEAGRALYQANSKDVASVLARLKGIHTNLPKNAKHDKIFIEKVIKTFEAQAKADGKNITVESPSAGTKHQQYKARAAQLNQLIRDVEGVIGDLLPADVAAQLKKPGAFLGLDAQKTITKGIESKIDAQIKVLTDRLDKARKNGDAYSIKRLSGEIDKLQGSKDRILRLARASLKVLQKADTVKNSQNLEKINELLKDGGIEKAILSFADGKNDPEKIEELEAAIEALEKEEIPVSSEANVEEPQMGMSSADTPGGPTATGGAGGDGIVEAIEAAKKVLIEEGQEQDFDDTLSTQSATYKEHAAIQSGWEGLSDSQMSMKIASSGVMMGITSSFYSQRSKERKLRSLIQKLIKAIEAGNLEAIGTALIVIAHKSKHSLRRAGLMVIKTMDYNQKKLEENNKILENLTKKNSGNIAADMQRINSEASAINMDNQAAVSMLRQIKATSDEFDTATKSWLDVQGPHQRALARWTA